MTTFERITAIISSLALVISLLSAAVSPWITFHWLDPATKPFKERAILIVTQSESLGPASNEHPRNVAVQATIEVRNIGRYPANNAKIVAVCQGKKPLEPEITIADRVAERTKKNGNVFEYMLSQPVAPDGTITVTAHGFLSSVYLFTEYGDKTVLYEPSPFVASGADW